MRMQKKEARRPRTAPREAVILFTVGATGFAIAAGAVEEIRGLEGLAPFAPPFSLQDEIVEVLDLERLAAVEARA